MEQDTFQAMQDVEPIQEAAPVASEPVIAPPAEPMTQEQLAAEFAKMGDDQKSYLHFQSYMRQFIPKLMNFQGSKKQLQQAWANAAVSPLNKEELQFGYPEAKELFDLFVEISSAKMLLMLYGLAKDGKITINVDLLPKAAEETAVQEAPAATETKEETANV